MVWPASGWSNVLGIVDGVVMMLLVLPVLVWRDDECSAIPFVTSISSDEFHQRTHGSDNGFDNSSNRDATSSLNSKNINHPSHIELQVQSGQMLRLQCDAEAVGLEPETASEYEVRELSLRRLSDSGCNPSEPVLTIAELKTGERFRHIPILEGWTIKGQLPTTIDNMTVTKPAFIQIIINSITIHESGTYRCDVTTVDVNYPVTQHTKTSYTHVEVSKTQVSHLSQHVPAEDSLVSVDHGSSIIVQGQNHLQVDDIAQITCSPRLLKSSLSPQRVKRLQIHYLPFQTANKGFQTVADLLTKNGSFILKQPANWKWKINRRGNGQTDTHDLRITIKIPKVSVDDTGLFRCVVTEGAPNGTEHTFYREAGLKVSSDSDVVPGYCEPKRPDKDQGWVKIEDTPWMSMVIRDDDPRGSQDVGFLLEKLGLTGHHHDHEPTGNGTGGEERRSKGIHSLACRVSFILMISWAVVILLLLLYVCFRKRKAKIEIITKTNMKIKHQQIKYVDVIIPGKKKKKKKVTIRILDVEDKKPTFYEDDIYWLDGAGCFPPKYVVIQDVPL